MVVVVNAGVVVVNAGVVTAVILATAGCGAIFDLDPVDEPSPGYRKPITITQRTQTTLENFPLSIVLDTDADLVAHVLDGTDLVFTDATGARLPCEVVDYDAATGRLDAWVLVPSLPPTPVVIELAYGVETTPCASIDAWPNTFAGVWHGSIATDRVRDSTVHRHDVVAISATSLPQPTAGISGFGLHYDGIDDAMCDPVDDDGSLAFGMSSFSYATWVNVDRNVGEFDEAFGKGGGSMARPGFTFELGDGAWRAFISDGVQPALGADLLPEGSLDTWVQLVAVVDRDAGELRTYVNGTARDVTVLGGWGAPDDDAMVSKLCIGDDPNLFAGLVDEPRIYATALSPAWIEVEYLNLAQRSELLTIGAETR